MAQFTVNAQRFDPYKNFKFRVKWDGQVCRRSQQSQRPEAHDGSRQTPRRRRSQQQAKVSGPHRVRGDHAGTRCDPRQGVRRWANKVWNFGSGLGAEVSLKDFRKDIIIEMYNEAGQLAIAYKITAVGFPSSRRNPILMPTPTRSRFKPSSLRTKVGNETRMS